LIRSAQAVTLNAVVPCIAPTSWTYLRAHTTVTLVRAVVTRLVHDFRADGPEPEVRRAQARGLGEDRLLLAAIARITERWTFRNSDNMRGVSRPTVAS